MKNKKFKSFICFLLCFVLLFSFPLNTTAHAAVAAPYVMYAIITYLASLGITFTVAGGVDAMIQAMEEKVDEYQKQAEIIDFYDIVRSGLKIVPPPNGGPNWDKNKGYFFLAFNAAMALTAFADWLVNDGGWNLGESVENELTENVCLAEVDGLTTYIEYSTFELISGDSYRFLYKGTPINSQLLFDQKVKFVTPENNYISLDIYEYSSNPEYTASVWENGNYVGYWIINLLQNGTYTWDTLPDIYIKKRGNDSLSFYVDNGEEALYMGYVSKIVPTNITFDTSTVISMPDKFIEFSLNDTEGLLIETGATAAETLEELGELFETVFTDTGTIPQPQPEVITDPDYAPQPTPVPTPVPSPEIEDIEDLGLPALGEAIFNKFPFSLPKDIARVFDILTAEPVTPYWEVDLTNDAIGISSKFVIDLEPYEAVGQICRWVSVISFSLFLIIITKGMIGW